MIIVSEFVSEFEKKKVSLENQPFFSFVFYKQIMEQSTVEWNANNIDTAVQFRGLKLNSSSTPGKF